MPKFDVTPELVSRVSKAVFGKVDTEHSGKINLRELQAMLGQVSAEIGEPLHGGDLKEVAEGYMKGYDRDGDGLLNYAEFEQVVEELLNLVAAKFD